jgi:multicomponent Na+:H+ antiporter subunit E
MTPFAINLILAFAWAALNGSITITSLLVGFVIGYVVLLVLEPLFAHSRYCRKLYDGIMLIGFFLYELVISSFKVAWDVLTPLQKSKPAVVAVPLDTCSDAELTVLANLVSLTPGSLSLDISDDHSHLLVHAMFVDDPAAFKQEIKQGMERRVLEALR